MRHDRRCFGRLEQEDQRLKKHYGRWMDIVRSLELELFILTKLTKPFVPVNLVGPQVRLPLPSRLVLNLNNCYLVFALSIDMIGLCLSQYGRHQACTGP